MRMRITFAFDLCAEFDLTALNRTMILFGTALFRGLRRSPAMADRAVSTPGHNEAHR